MRSPAWVLPFAALFFACANDDAAGGAEANATGSTEIALSVLAKPLESFHYDTGLIPAGSPAQVQLELSAGGNIAIQAAGTPSDKGLEGKKGSGKVAIDLHVKLDGRLKSESALGSTDGDLPGLEDIDIAIKGETSFDPFLVGQAQEAKLDAKIPAADLPEIPLGATPGKLRLSVVEGSVLHTKFKGSCVSVTKEKASYAGDLTTSGTLILKGTLAVEIAGFEKSVELGEIAVPIPELTTALDFEGKDAKGAGDGKDGAKCGGATSSATTPNEGVTPGAPSSSASSQAGATDPEPETSSSCIEDAQEPNQSMSAAYPLGGIGDTGEVAHREKTLTGYVGGNDQDWFTIDVIDEGLDGNPTLTVSTDDANLEVAVYFACASPPSSSACERGTTESSLGMTGCRGFESVALATGCSGSSESGRAFVHVVALDEACHGYTLHVSAD